MKKKFYRKLDQNYMEEENPFPIKKFPSLRNKFSNLITPNYGIDPMKNQILNINNNDIRRSFDNLNNDTNSKKLKRFNTHKNVNRINLKNNSKKYQLQNNNEFILAKKNNLYGLNTYNNGKVDNNLNNDNLLLNEKEILSKTIKMKYKLNLKQKKNYRIINKNKSYNQNSISLNNSNNLLTYQNTTNNNYKKYTKNTFNLNKKISDNIIYNYDLNATMPKRKEPNTDYFNLSNEKKLVNNNDNFQKQNDYFRLGLLHNQQLMNQKKKSNISIIKKRNINLKANYSKKHNTEKKEGNSWDFRISILNTDKAIKKSRSNKISKSFFSKKKINIYTLNKYNDNDEDDISDTEIDELVDDILEQQEKMNKTVILQGKGLSDDSFNLSEIADDIVQSKPETDDDINFKETVPSTSNPDNEGINTNYINNNINMSDVKYDYTFSNNQITNNKPTIVNNFYISSPEVKNINNNLDNDFNYQLFLVNNNTNDKIIKNNNISIPKFENKEYKSSINLLKGINKMNSEDINKIEGEGFKKFKNISLNNEINQNNIIFGLNYSSNLSDNIKYNSILNKKNSKDLSQSEKKSNKNNKINMINKTEIQNNKLENIKNKKNI